MAAQSSNLSGDVLMLENTRYASHSENRVQRFALDSFVKMNCQKISKRPLLL